MTTETERKGPCLSCQFPRILRLSIQGDNPQGSEAFALCCCSLSADYGHIVSNKHGCGHWERKK